MSLPGRNSAIVEAYLAGQSYSDIAAQHSISTEAVRHIVRGVPRSTPKPTRGPAHRAAWHKASDARNQPYADGIAWMATALTGYSLAELRKRCNKREVSRVRYAVVYALTQSTGWSRVRIAEFLNRSDHGLITSAVASVKFTMSREPLYAKLVEALVNAPPRGDVPELPRKTPPPERCATTSETFRMDDQGRTNGELRTAVGMIDGSAGLAKKLGVTLTPIRSDRLWCAQCDRLVAVAKAEMCQSLYCKAPV